MQQSISTDQAWHYHIVPKLVDEDKFVFYADEEKMNSSISDELEMIFGKTIQIIPSSTELINKTLGKYYRLTYKNKRAETVSFDATNSEDFAYKLIAEAVAKCSLKITKKGDKIDQGLELLNLSKAVFKECSLINVLSGKHFRTIAG